jgi:hypothetical protein
LAGIVGLLAGGFFGRLDREEKRIKPGRPVCSITGMGICGCMIFLAATFKAK